ncbi:MAG: DUF4159 domain-containing protein, partial [Pseudomonadota bacterium]
WAPDRAAWADWLSQTGQDAESWWLTDGLAHDAEDDGFAEALIARGPATRIAPVERAMALRPARLENGLLVSEALRADPDAERTVQIVAVGTDPAGTERRLAVLPARFETEALEAPVTLDLPLELRNRIARIGIASEPSAGAVILTDSALKRRKVGLLSGAEPQEGADLVSSLHYLRQALQPSAEVIEAPLADMLNASPDVLILADIGTFAADERAALEEWVREGGLLVRFAGPRMARAAGVIGEDPLLPVRLRAGGRTVGGALSWGAPRTLREFAATSPFSGLAVPQEVSVTRQVMAQPDPDLPDRTLAALEDGTSLVTAADLGEGRVVLFHVTANAEWSSLPLSGLFVQMLERLAISARPGALSADDLAGSVWTPVTALDGFGRPVDVTDLPGVSGERLAEARPGADAPPGLYRSGDRLVAINLTTPDTVLTPAAPPPAGMTAETLDRTTETPLKPWVLVAALALLAADLLATLWLGGRLRFATRPAGTIAAALLAVGAVFVALPAAAQDATDPQTDPTQASDPVDEEWALLATRDTVLAYVITGDTQVDRISAAGLSGLSRMLAARTAIEPGEPMAVNIETDELAFFPMLYWPISEGQRAPSDAAIAKLNAYLRTGGMIVFDTRDANLGAGFSTGTPNGKVLQRIAARLDIPPLEPLPEDHVLTRTFYLLQAFPGRHVGGELWVEAAEDARAVEGLPFRNLNDGVTPVVIGSNDWAAAWALDGSGRPMFPVGRTLGGDRQREMAWRFGINLVMHVMTGNYKSDQVHVPALLERLGQ